MEPALPACNGVPRRADLWCDARHQCACEVRGHVAGAGGGGSPAVSSRESGNGGRAVSNGLSVKDLGKAYRTYRSELQRFARWFGIPVRPATENWVLRRSEERRV